MLHLIVALWVVLFWQGNGDVGKVYGTFSTLAAADNYAIAGENAGYITSVDSVALPDLRVRRIHRRSSVPVVVIWYNGLGDWQQGIQGLNGLFSSWQNAEFYAEYRCFYYRNQSGCLYSINNVVAPVGVL